jgi:hypothetical protein
MVLMHDAPPASNLAETHSQSKFQLFALAVRTDARALTYRRGESHIFARSDLHVVKVKGDRLLRP